MWLSLLSEDPNLPFPEADFYLSPSEYSGLAWPSGWRGGRRWHDRLHQQCFRPWDSAFLLFLASEEEGQVGRWA